MAGRLKFKWRIRTSELSKESKNCVRITSVSLSSVHRVLTLRSGQTANSFPHKLMLRSFRQDHFGEMNCGHSQVPNGTVRIASAKLHFVCSEFAHALPPNCRWALLIGSNRENILILLDPQPLISTHSHGSEPLARQRLAANWISLRRRDLADPACRVLPV